MISILQINIGNCRATQDLVRTTTDQEKIDVVIISEQYRNTNEDNGWHSDQSGLSAVEMVNKEIPIDEAGPCERGFKYNNVLHYYVNIIC